MAIVSVGSAHVYVGSQKGSRRSNDSGQGGGLGEGGDDIVRNIIFLRKRSCPVHGTCCYCHLGTRSISVVAGTAERQQPDIFHPLPAPNATGDPGVSSDTRGRASPPRHRSGTSVCRRRRRRREIDPAMALKYLRSVLESSPVHIITHAPKIPLRPALTSHE